MFARICVLLAVTAVGLLVAAPSFAATQPPSWAPTGVSTNDLCPSRTGTTFQATSGSFVQGLPLPRRSAQCHECLSGRTRPRSLSVKERSFAGQPTPAGVVMFRRRAGAGPGRKANGSEGIVF